jgi:hypothetical protein
MIAAAFWAIKTFRTWDTWVGTELNRRPGREILPRIPSNEKRRCQRASLSSGAAAAARLQEGVIAKHLPSQSGQEWVEFEEVPGPDPSPPQELKFGQPRYIDVVLVAPYARLPSEETCP